MYLNFNCLLDYLFVTKNFVLIRIYSLLTKVIVKEIGCIHVLLRYRYIGVSSRYAGLWRYVYLCRQTVNLSQCL